MKHARTLGGFGLLSLLAVIAVNAGMGDGSAAKPKYIRLRRDADNVPLTMETSIVRMGYANPAKGTVIVDLVGAVHVGEKSYYETLNKVFTEYDVVLYEFVAPETKQIPQKNAPASGVGVLQRIMKDFLELDFQLDCVDYSKPNFVHADMTPAQFSATMAKRGESIWTILAKVMQQGMAQQRAGKQPNEFEILLLFFRSDRALAMKRMVAEQFEDLENSMAIFNGPDGSTIITERNKVALQVLRDQLAKGKKKIAIFYGAGHLPDLEARLVKDFGLRRQSDRWLVAWDLDPKENKPRAKPFEAKPADSKPAGQTRRRTNQEASAMP